MNRNHLHMVRDCTCTEPNRCFNKDGTVANILCQLKENKERTLRKWAEKLFYPGRVPEDADAKEEDTTS